MQKYFEQSQMQEDDEQLSKKNFMQKYFEQPQQQEDDELFLNFCSKIYGKEENQQDQIKNNQFYPTYIIGLEPINPESNEDRMLQYLDQIQLNTKISNQEEQQEIKFIDQLSKQEKEQLQKKANAERPLFNQMLQKSNKQNKNRFFTLETNINDEFPRRKQLTSFVKTKIYQTQKMTQSKKKRIRKIKVTTEEKLKRQYSCELIPVDSQSQWSKAKKNLNRYTNQAIIKHFLDPLQLDWLRSQATNEEQLRNSLIDIAQKREKIQTIKNLHEEFLINPLFQKSACLFILKEGRRWALTGNQLNFQLYLQQLKKIAKNFFEINKNFLQQNGKNYQ